MKNQFFKIAATETTEVTDSATKNIAELQTLTTVKEITDKWYFRNYMTRDAQRKTWVLADLITYITKRINVATAKKVETVKMRLDTVHSATRVITSISISVEWKRSRMWGNNPTANIRVCFNGNTCDTYNSGSIGGCGYDKESTAVARALNQCNELLNLMYTKKENNIDTNNRELFGYGSGYGVKPYFEGGVGVSCYPSIFATIGYEWACISSGKTFDVYNVKQIVG